MVDDFEARRRAAAEALQHDDAVQVDITYNAITTADIVQITTKLGLLQGCYAGCTHLFVEASDHFASGLCYTVCSLLGTYLGVNGVIRGMGVAESQITSWESYKKFRRIWQQYVIPTKSWIWSFLNFGAAV